MVRTRTFHGTVALLAAAALSMSLLGATGAVPASATVAASLPPIVVAPVCPGYSGLNNVNPYASVNAGYYTPDTRRAVKVATGVSVNWASNPYSDASWQSWFQSLKWLGSLVLTAGGRSIATGAHTTRSPTPAERTAALNKALGITANYLAHNPKVATAPTALQIGSMAHRTQFLACLIEAAGPSNTPAWLINAARAHAAYLAVPAHYRGAWNQGMDQSLGMLAVGCVAGPAVYRNLAVSRLTASLNIAVDSEGVPNEQAPGYAAYQYNLWVKVQQVTTRCGLASSSAISDRIGGIPAFLTQATQPNGRLVQLGDTVALPTPAIPGTEYAVSLGAQGTQPADRVAIYRQSGFIFGRSSWSPFTNASFYSLRFGPAIANHGHFDRTAVTWMVAGKDRLVDSGHVGYTNVALRVALRAPEAHNLLSADQFVGFRPAARPTALLSSSTLDTADSFLLSTHGYGYKNATGWHYTTERRGALIARGPDLLIVNDGAGGAPKPVAWRQHWHLPVGWTARVLDRNRVEASHGSDRTTIIRVAASLGSLPVQLVASSQAPALNVRYANIDVRFSSSGRSTSLLTVVAPFAAALVHVTLVGRTLTVSTPNGTVVSTINTDGSLTRIS